MSSTPLSDALKDSYAIQAINWYTLCQELERKIADHELTIATIRDTVTNDKMSTKGKVLAIQHILREEAQP